MLLYVIIINIFYVFFISVFSEDVTCGFPGAPAHSTVELSGSPIPGAVATYTCERGFELLGPSRRVCAPDGQWTPNGIPFCGKRFVQFEISKGKT